MRAAPDEPSLRAAVHPRKTARSTVDNAKDGGFDKKEAVGPLENSIKTVCVAA